ncbi:MAG: DUF1801 domain-containing protein [Thermoanaerobaculia bacterium]|nr:DUF1801 domain-containing protein [Thermoanaerobaculia bacterium]MCZ7650358.1 DUF1801 domain-containing protein [Thermoanaerobaculia bacterium]
MAELKTAPTGASVAAFVAAVDDAGRRADCERLLEIMQRVTGAPPAMWGPSIVGFGRYRYRYTSGREGHWMLAGFSPRKRDLTVYVLAGFAGQEERLARLGKHRASGGSCLYLKRLADVDLAVLEELLRASVAEIRRTYPDEPAS